MNNLNNIENEYSIKVAEESTGAVAPKATGKVIQDIDLGYSKFSWENIGFKTAYTIAGFGIGAGLTLPIAPVALFGAVALVIPLIAGAFGGVLGFGIGRKAQEEAESEGRIASYYSVNGDSKLKKDLDYWESILNSGDIKRGSGIMFVVGQKLQERYKGVKLHNFATVTSMGVGGLLAGGSMAGEGVGGLVLVAVGVAGLGLVMGGLLKSSIILTKVISENIEGSFFSNEKHQRKSIEKYRALIPEIQKIQIRRNQNNEKFKPQANGEGVVAMKKKIESEEDFERKVGLVNAYYWEGKGGDLYRELLQEYGKEKKEEIDKILIKSTAYANLRAFHNISEPSKLEKIYNSLMDKIEKATKGELEAFESQLEVDVFNRIVEKSKRFSDGLPRNIEEISESILNKTEAEFDLKRKAEQERKEELEKKEQEKKRDYLEVFLESKTEVLKKEVTEIINFTENSGNLPKISQPILDMIKKELEVAAKKEEEYYNKKEVLKKISNGLVCLEATRSIQEKNVLRSPDED